jgi:hypothetical protein
VTWQIRQPQKCIVQNHAIWTMKKNDCGTVDMESVCLTGDAPPCTKQYPISKVAIATTKVVSKDLWDMCIVEKTPQCECGGDHHHTKPHDCGQCARGNCPWCCSEPCSLRCAITLVKTSFL